ncbi:hypothetical protein KCMC57_up10480 [Kitasatospora sp. CMC57]|uniref:Uncharacterized protein n=1 Tax=Kitasatospora sp. CMC57 TaxID=3231513 RepID=A0AB33JPE4_9ACTN
MAASTCSRVVPITPEWPLATRETVCEDTPASLATSAIETRCLRRPPGIPEPPRCAPPTGGTACSLNLVTTSPVLLRDSAVRKFLRRTP